MNPYNHGCFHNVKEVLFSGIPKSMNNFRAKVIEDSARFTSSHSTGQVMAPDLPKPSFDLEIGVKRHTVSAEELEDIQNQFEIRPLERSDSQPPHSIWTDDKDYSKLWLFTSSKGRVLSPAESHMRLSAHAKCPQQETGNGPT
ncbi:hypothetical protein GW17_00009345 [Ensete ventricosum]|uniref:Uncharacterized protein n=1 Tax=Ensete ventricosum TaxID=4639 RepID=A0A444FUG4_ENSVE|nr:hypothetical protein GW17_00009345 [Ensete ventricosum]RZR73128.1 hypothetical protein BHM03_00020552 [Ensete ventricosum]